MAATVTVTAAHLRIRVIGAPFSIGSTTFRTRRRGHGSAVELQVRPSGSETYRHFGEATLLGGDFLLEIAKDYRTIWADPRDHADLLREIRGRFDADEEARHDGA